jgi:hypothetical protein
VSGKLIDAAAERGIVSDTYHRALADVWVTARLLESLAAEHGLGVLEEHIGRGPKRGGTGGSSSRDARRAELVEHFSEHGSLPDLEQFGDRHDIKRSTAEGDVMRLIDEGVLSSSVLERREVQAWLAERLEAAIASEWHGEAEGRLKPLMEVLLPGAPEGLDYTQLRLALMKREKV